MLSTKAPGAEVEPFWLTIYGDSNRVNIGYPAAVGMMFGVANVVTKLG